MGSVHNQTQDFTNLQTAAPHYSFPPQVNNLLNLPPVTPVYSLPQLYSLPANSYNTYLPAQEHSYLPTAAPSALPAQVSHVNAAKSSYSQVKDVLEVPQFPLTSEFIDFVESEKCTVCHKRIEYREAGVSVFTCVGRSNLLSNLNRLLYPYMMKIISDMVCRSCYQLITRVEDCENKLQAANKELILSVHTAASKLPDVHSPEITRKRKKDTTSKPKDAPLTPTSDKLDETTLPKLRKGRCNECEACKLEDCGECKYCLDKVKFGGTGALRQTCIKKRCKQNTVCHICGKSFTLSHALTAHIKTIHEGKRDHLCNICGKSFAGHTEIRRHVKKEHSQPSSSKSHTGEANAMEMASDHQESTSEHQGERLHACGRCDKSFSYPGHLERHIEAVHEGVRHKCEICDKTFSQIGGLKIHIKTVHEGGKVACSFCSERFTLADLKIHVKNSHDRAIVCHICGKSFTANSHLKVHVETIHEGKREHLCTICGKDFQQGTALTRHIKTVHTGEGRTQCRICDKTFGRPPHLRRHMRIVHEGVKAFVCEICAKRFGEKFNLVHHIKTVHDGARNRAVPNYQ